MSDLYQIPFSNLVILSNAAFLDSEHKLSSSFSTNDIIRIGFLSNVMREKGIFEFFSFIDKANELNFPLSACIAGPVDDSIKHLFFNKLNKSTNVKYVGPVYGPSKREFFNSIDLLFFPTRYKNEAQPLTIFEALSHGVPVISFDRGCILDMIPSNAGLVIPYSSDFDSIIIEFLKNFVCHGDALVNYKNSARDAFESAKRHAEKSLCDFVTRL